MLGFFGAAGLGFERVEARSTSSTASSAPRRLPWGVNLIHSPNEPDLEAAVADLLCPSAASRRVDASAFMA
jgi:trans-AT polyketide synthase/acyltransferase/oxidoreductase domain-containing protein